MRVRAAVRQGLKPTLVENYLRHDQGRALIQSLGKAT
jgi:hypothetical protein